MAWYNASWSKRKKITLTGGASGAQTDYQIKLAITYDSDMKSDFSDLRFTKADGTTLVDAWLETHTASTSATVWVEFPTTPANTVTEDYYMYYGNSGASSDWNMTGTFPDLCDDFEDNDVTDWTGSTMAIESSVVKTGTYSGKATGSTGPYKTGTSKTTDYSIEFDYRQPGTSDRYFAVGANGVYVSNCIFFRLNAGILYYSDGSYHSLGAMASDVWHKFIVNVHFSTNTFDVSLNGGGFTNGCGTRGNITVHNDINSVPNGQTEYFDNIFSRKYVASPATYAFGSEGWDSSLWTKRQKLTLTGGASGAQTDYQIKLTIPYDTDMKSDFSDLRFTTSTGTVLIDAWLEDYTASTSATVWVKFPTTPANTITEDYYMYYGNSSGVSNWDIGGTFLFGDDFSGSAGAPDSSLWTVEKKGSTSATVALDGSGNLELAGAPNIISSGNLKSIETFTNAICIRTKRYDSSEYYRDISLGYGTIRGVTSAANWWHTTFTDGYCFFTQTDLDSKILRMDSGTYTYITSLVDLPNHGSWRIYDMIYDAAGKLDFIVDGTSYVNVTDTTHLSNAKNILLSQGEYSAGQGGPADIDYVLVYKYTASPATYVFGSEEPIGSTGSAIWYYRLLQVRRN